MRTQLHLNNSKSSLFDSRTLANIWIAYENPRISHTKGKKTMLRDLIFLWLLTLKKSWFTEFKAIFENNKNKKLFPNTTAYTLMLLKHASRLKWNLKLKRHKMFANVFIYVCLEFHSQFRNAFVPLFYFIYFKFTLITR